MLFFALSNVYSQAEQDCFGAIPVCTGFYDQEESYSGTGEIDNELPGGFNDCLSIDANSVWYTFTVESSGDLSFILTPNSTNADYDWMVFDFSSGDCDEISSNSDLIVSCNSFGLVGENGPTGVSSAMGGTGNSNGPGNTNGPAFNQDIPVSAGDTYLLYIQDWSGSTEGYTLDFSVSTASIFDNEPPEITSVTPQCNGDLLVEFSENIECANLELADLVISTSAGLVSPNSMESDCSDNDSNTSFAILSFLDIPGQNLPEGEGMTLQVLGENGLLTDLCGNTIEDLFFDFSTSELIAFETEVLNAECGLSNGQINVLGTTGGIGPYTYSINSGTQASSSFEGLASGIYTVTVTDAIDCFSFVEVILEEVSAIEVDAGPDDTLCNAVYQLSGTVSGEGSIEWVSNDGLIFGDENSLNSTVTTLVPGVYTLQLISTQNGCDSSDEVEISFSGIQNSFTNDLATCAENCTGELDINTTDGIEPYSYSLNGVNQGVQSSYSSLCTGEYTLEVTDAIGCSTSDSFIISALIEAELLNSEVIDVTCLDGCNGEVIIATESTSIISSPLVEFDNSTNSFTELCAGNFIYTITSSDNCTTIFSETISTLSQLDAALNISSNPVDIENPIVELTDISSGNPVSSQLSFLTETELDFQPETFMDFTGHDGSPITIQLLVEDEYGCLDSEEYTLNFITPLLVFVPNAFSPNNDGINEGFIPVISGLDEDEYEFIVFDRWGHQVFSSVDPTEAWRGNVNEGDYYIQPGTYTYSLKVKQIYTSFEEKFFGVIQVVR